MKIHQSPIMELISFNCLSWYS